MPDAVNTVIITWGFPPRELSPNRAPFGSVGAAQARGRVKREYRRDCRLSAIVAMQRWRPVPPWKQALVVLVAYQPDRRHRDRDNLIASLKPAFDSLADAGLIEDDRGLRFGTVEWAVDPRQPRVVAVVKKDDV